MNALRIGIDLGGTKTEGIVLDRSGVELRRLRIPTPRSCVETLDAIAGLVRDLESGLPGDENATVGIGIGTDGAGAGAGVVFGVILGTGIGGGISIDRVPLDSPNLIAGEWGHNPLRDGDAMQALARYTRRLAKSLSTVINILDPEVIVLGGGMSNIDDLAERVRPLPGAYVFSNSIETRALRNMHGDSSGVRGAAWLWPNEM